MKITTGTSVSWTSQSGGITKTKVGHVVAVVPAMTDVEKIGDFGLKWPGYPRDHESYVVHVPSKTGKGRGKFYWPRVSALRATA